MVKAKMHRYVLLGKFCKIQKSQTPNNFFSFTNFPYFVILYLKKDIHIKGIYSLFVRRIF